jgi:uncharacterized membrane protein required for colicin V production
MNFNGQIPFNWFDVVVFLTLLIGYKRGQARGMSQESLSVLKWIGIVIVAAIAYEPLGLWISTAAQLSRLLSFVIAYAAIAAVVALVFILISSSLGEKLKGSDAFGKAEFHLGKPAGMLRFLCILLALLALLNARYYSTAEVRAATKYQNDNYGSNFFPTLSSIQDGVFRESFLGKQAKEHISFLFIKPTPATGSSQTASGSSESKPASKTGKQRDYALP